MFNLDHIFVTKILDLLGDSPNFFMNKCVSKLLHNLRMWFFNNKIRKNQWEQSIHQTAGCKPFDLHFPFGIMMFSRFIINKTSKCLMYPRHQFAICIRDLKSWMITPISFYFSSLNINGTLSIYDACKVAKFSFFPHTKFLFNEYKRLGIKCHADRLSEKTSKEDAIVGPSWQHEEGGITRLPAIERWSVGLTTESNRLVLSWVTERLGVAMFEARQFGLFKPDLIDLEPLTDNAEGDKAQAG